MKKPFLLIAGDAYYPSPGTGDWIAFYETVAEAREQIEYVDYPTYYTKGKMKGQVKWNDIRYRIKSSKCPFHEYDWYEIADVREWTE